MGAKGRTIFRTGDLGRQDSRVSESGFLSIQESPGRNRVRGTETFREGVGSGKEVGILSGLWMRSGTISPTATSPAHLEEAFGISLHHLLLALPRPCACATAQLCEKITSSWHIL